MNIRSSFKSEFGKNVLTIFTGTTIAQVIPFIVSPFLTRLYTPEDFGLLALFTAVFSIVSIIVTLQYEAAIVLPKEEIDAANLVGLCLFLTIFISLITFLIVFLFSNTISHWLGDERIKFWLNFVPIPIFLIGIYNTFNYWATRKKQYKRLAVRTISQSTTTAGTKVLFGYVGATNGGLISGTLIGQATATGVLSWLTWSEDKNILKKITKKGIVKIAKVYKNFPKYNAWQGFLDIINTSGMNFIIIAFFGISTLGLYSFTISILQKPLQLIGNSVSQVYYQKASDLYNAGINLWIITKKLILRLSLLSLIIFIPILFLGPFLFKFLFGQDWLVAGKYAQLLVPWMLARFICSPLANIANILNKQKFLLFLAAIYNLLFPVCFIILIKLKFSFDYSLFFLSVFAFIYYIIVIVWIKQITDLKPKTNEN